MAVPSGLELGARTDLVGEERTGRASSPPGRHRGRLLRLLRSDVAVVLSAGYVVVVVLAAVFAPLLVRLSGWGPYEFDQAAIDPNLGGLPLGWGGGISAEHWLGVEPGSGRDVFARVVYGARVSMGVALAATALTTTTAVVMGLLAGFHGGVVDLVISRVMDFLMAFPALIFMIAVLSALPAENRQALLVLVISVFGWPYLARVVRGQTISLTQREFVEAARASGAGGFTIVFREVLPNLRSTLVVMTTLAVPGYIGTEAGLSFLGIGVIPPTPSWGQMIATSSSWYAVDPAYFFIPSACLFLLVFSFTVLGDRLRTLTDSGELR